MVEVDKKILELIKEEGNYGNFNYISKNGLEFDCFIRRNDSMVWCGYIEVHEHNKYYNKPYDEADIFDVHGGLTYSGDLTIYKDNIEIPKYFFGFDCAHGGDMTIYTINFKEPIEYKCSSGIYRNKEYVISECEKLAEQLSLQSKKFVRNKKINELLK